MKLLARQLTVVVISVLFLTIFGALGVPEVSAQRACTMDNEAATCGALGAQFRCISNRCNLPPPIWNVAGTGLQTLGQNARLYLAGTGLENSARIGNLQIGLGNLIANVAGGEVAVNWAAASAARVGRGFTVYNGNAAPWFRVDENGGVSINQGLNVGSVTGAVAGEIRTSGGIIAGTIMRGNFVSTAGASCAANQILKRNAVGTAWECQADATGAAGAVAGCFGPVYRRPSGAGRDGNRGGYLSANAECPAGMRVCGTAEILESINCGALALPGVDVNGGTPMWINNLAPSLPTPTNDCGGWRTNAAGSVGVVYSYSATGGVAGTAACNSALRFACCQ